MTLSRYRGPRRTPATLRLLRLDDEASTQTSVAEDPLGGGSGVSLPAGTLSRYRGPRREQATLRMLSLFEPPTPVVEEEAVVSDPLPILFI